MVVPRRSSRQTAGKHSNIHGSVNMHGTSRQRSISEQSLADLSQAHKMLVELFCQKTLVCIVIAI